MNWNKLLYNPHEQPLERIVDGYSHTSIFRSIAFVGDSMSSGEFETRDAEGRPGYPLYTNLYLVAMPFM